MGLIGMLLGLLGRSNEALLDWETALSIVFCKEMQASPLVMEGNRWKGKAYNSIGTVFYERSVGEPLLEEVWYTANWASFPLKATFENGRLVRWCNRKKDLPATMSDNFRAVQFMVAIRNLFPAQEQSSHAKTAAS